MHDLDLVMHHYLTDIRLNYQFGGWWMYAGIMRVLRVLAVDVRGNDWLLPLS